MRERGGGDKGKEAEGNKGLLTMAQVPMVGMLLEPAKGAWVL
jgi:hypothetical protein